MSTSDLKLPVVQEGPSAAKAVNVPGADGKLKQIKPRLKKVCDLIVFQGLDWSAAAVKAGITTRAVRAALEKEHVKRYLRELKATYRDSVSARVVHHVADVLANSENGMAKVAAAKLIESMDEKSPVHSAGRQVIPGVVVNIVSYENPNASAFDFNQVIEVHDVTPAAAERT